jgi:hypothetical protein
MGQGKHIVKVRTWQEFCLSVTQPFFFDKRLAFWTVPVPAGVVGILCETAFVTRFTMAPEYCGTAHFNMIHCFGLFRGQEVTPSIIFTILTEDVG